MLILGLESSAKSASAALSRDGTLLAQYFQRSGQTHSKTLLPMAEALLRDAGVSFADIDTVAVAHGPGSFTGVRIGVAAAKGLCWGADKPAIGVSTLAAMAWGGGCESLNAGSVICCAMDARRGQVYNALFRWTGGAPERLTKDRAISLAELSAELKAGPGGLVYVLGDGAELCYAFLIAEGHAAVLAPEAVRMQSAWGVCRAAEGSAAGPRSAAELLPVYLRLSQAERERQARRK